MAVEFSFIFFLWNNHQVPGDMMFLFFLTLTTRFFGVMICLDVFFAGVKFVLNVGAEALIAKMSGDMFGDTPFSTGSLNLT